MRKYNYCQIKTWRITKNQGGKKKVKFKKKKTKLEEESGNLNVQNEKKFRVLNSI